MTKQQELAEQLLKKHFGHAYGALHPIMHVSPMVAAIVEAMNTCPHCCKCDGKCSACVEGGYPCNATYRKEVCPHCSVEAMNTPAADEKYKINPEHEKITGWPTLAEWWAFEKGQEAHNNAVIEHIQAWDGVATNSGLYNALKKK